MRISQLSPQWLAAALEVDPARITSLETAPVGTGQMADTYRLSFHLDGAAQSLILKLTSDAPASRETARRQLNYVREVRYYQALAATVEVRAPRCRHACISDDSTEFSLLLEDMAPCRPGDQLDGCSVAEAEAVLGEAAKLHAARWADPALATVAWLPVAASAKRPGPGSFVAIFARFCERYGDQIDDEVLAVGTEFFARITEYYQAQADAPQTVAHGDFRPDNILFGGHAGEVPVTVVDWQTVQVGPAMADVSYFIGGALPTDVRRTCERSLLERYHEELRRRGVPYSLADCWQDYARFSLQNYLVGVGAAMAVKQTERGDQMFISMVRRAGYHALDLDALALLGRGRAG
jgi:aminoglycoside phosphotransferase (APT) family kinase protein